MSNPTPNLIQALQNAGLDLGPTGRPYARLTMALAQQGFEIKAMYIDGKAVQIGLILEADNVADIFNNLAPDIISWWENAQGRTVIMCTSLGTGEGGDARIFVPLATGGGIEENLRAVAQMGN